MRALFVAMLFFVGAVVAYVIAGPDSHTTVRTTIEKPHLTVVAPPSSPLSARAKRRARRTAVGRSPDSTSRAPGAARATPAPARTPTKRTPRRQPTSKPKPTPKPRPAPASPSPTTTQPPSDTTPSVTLPLPVQVCTDLARINPPCP
jgi:hypothetical protein